MAEHRTTVVDGSCGRTSLSHRADREKPGIKGKKNGDRQYDKNHRNHHGDFFTPTGFQQLPLAERANVSGLGSEHVGKRCTAFDGDGHSVEEPGQRLDPRAVAQASQRGQERCSRTGLGKDAPGSPLTDAVVFPDHGIVWDLNYRGDLIFLEQARKQVDVARETVSSESNVKVANILADGQKQAAEIDAQRDLDIAKIALEIAQLDSKRTQILGKADADVVRLNNEADAKGAKLLIDAFGSPQAYNNYIFAKNFDPTDLRLIFAGPGTFWTDLKSFQDVGAAKMVQTPPSEKK